MRYLALSVAIICACGMTPHAVGQMPAEAVAVEPAELERRPDLIGRQVVVDDHVKYYVARTGSEPDELQLKRTPITFQVPRGLRPQASTRITFVIVRGVLRATTAGWSARSANSNRSTATLTGWNEGSQACPQRTS